MVSILCQDAAVAKLIEKNKEQEKIIKEQGEMIRLIPKLEEMLKNFVPDKAKAIPDRKSVCY